MKHSKLMTHLWSYLGQFMFALVYRTSRWEIRGEEYFNKALVAGRPIMLCVWHGRFSFPAFWLAKNRIHAYAIASRHGDAAIIAQIFKRWGFGLIRGSSSQGSKDKGGHDVIREMNRIFDAPGTNIIAVTNDGPKGPPRIAKPGSLAIALKKDVQIITISGSASSYKAFGSWDKFRIPRPFSTVYLNIAPRLEMPSEKISSEEEVQYLSDYMNKYQDEVDEWAESK
jgi:lysophospholipid acyltransferase (LPLAT)-like uncharacterized protein